MEPSSPLAYAAGQRLGFLEQAKTLGVELARQAGGALVARAKRDATLVAEEYEQGRWQRVMDDEPWTSFVSILDYTSTGDTREIIAKLDGHLVRIAAVDYYHQRNQRVRRLMLEEAGDTDVLFELGCGTGFNLLLLCIPDRWKSLHGFDVSPTALAAAQKAALHFGVADQMRFHRLDLTNSSDPAFRELEGQVAFTYYCLEQLKRSTQQVIGNLLDAGLRRGIHVEPTTELLDLWRPADLVNYLYIRRRDYQDRLLRTLRGFERAGRLRITRTERLGFAPAPRHDPTLIVWEQR